MISRVNHRRLLSGNDSTPGTYRHRQANFFNTYVTLWIAPGEVFQSDWGKDYAIIDSVNTKLHIAHFKRGHSRSFFLRVYLTQAHEMLFGARHHAFDVLGGIAECGL